MTASVEDAGKVLRGPWQFRKLLGPRAVKAVAKVLVDGAVAATAFYAALLLRFDGVVPTLAFSIPLALVLIPLWKVAVGLAAGTYRPLWRYASLNEVAVLSASSIVATLALLLFASMRLLHIPRSVLLIDGALFLVGTAGVRALRRLQVSHMKRRSRAVKGERARALFVGAGDTTHALLTEIDHRNHAQWDIVGLLDDDPSKVGASVRGHRVLGSTTQLEAMISRYGLRHVVIAMPSADPDVIRRLVGRARSSGASVLVAPPSNRFIRTATTPPPLKLADLLNSTELAAALTIRSQERSRPLVLVTGGAGYIGSHLVKRLLESNHRVRILDNFTYGRRGIEQFRNHPDVEIVTGDISSIRNTVSAVKNVDSVIALAAIVGDPACGLNTEETLNLNYESTKVLVEACSFYNVKRLVFASSCSVYGASGEGVLTEASALHPVSLYARTRILSEDVVFNRCGDVQTVILRLSTVFGQSPRMRYDLVVNALTARAVVDHRIEVFGGAQWRPFVHCRDAAKAFQLAVSAPAEAVAGQVFNVGDDRMNYTIAEVGAVVARTVGGVDLRTNENIEDARNYRVSFNKIHERLGFERDFSVEDGVLEMAGALQSDPELREYRRTEYSNVEALRQRFRTPEDPRVGGEALAAQPV